MEEACQISGYEIIKNSGHEQSQSVEDERSNDPPLGDGSDNVEEARRDCDSDEQCNKPKEEDRISTLPDDILLHILTFLPTLDAVTTGTLSPRWENVWTLLPNLDFIYTRHHFDTNSSFATFVDETLILHRRRKVKRFLLQFGYDESFASSVNVWVRCATRRNVEQLSLCLSCSNITKASCLYALPLHIYTTSSITGLVLSGCNVAPKRLIDWRRLKSLTIGETKLGEDVVQKILLGSPVLEFMKLHNFCGINCLDVSSARLRKLVITNYYLDPFPGSISELEIIAPNIHSLEISGSMFMNKCRLINVESLVECCLNFNLILDAGVENNDYEVERNLMRELLHSLRHVEKLTLGDWGIQTLSMMEAKGIPSPRSSRKYLILESCIQKSDLPGIASLLESSPNLETLTIDMNSSCSLSYREFFAYYEFDGEKYWTSQERSFTCLLLHLKTVKIVGFIAAGHSTSGLMFPLVQFLLKSARSLEKMVIDASKVDFDGSRKNPDPRDLYQATQKLLSFSRCSREAVVLFSE